MAVAEQPDKAPAAVRAAAPAMNERRVKPRDLLEVMSVIFGSSVVSVGEIPA